METKSKLYQTEIEFKSKSGEMIRAFQGNMYIADLHDERFEKSYGPIVKETDNVMVREHHGRKMYFIARNPYRTFIAEDGTECVDLTS